MELEKPLTATWGSQQISDDQALERIHKLENQVKEYELKIIQKDSLLQRFENWQIDDKYLQGADETTKQVIDEHRFKQQQAHDQENKEMADAAYQTIKTMQEMLEQKNAQLKRKEENIANLRDQVKRQAEMDANELNKLRN